MVPVILLSDGYIANGSEPWRLPDVDKLPKFPVRFAQARAQGGMTNGKVEAKAVATRPGSPNRASTRCCAASTIRHRNGQPQLPG